MVGCKRGIWALDGTTRQGMLTALMRRYRWFRTIIGGLSLVAMASIGGPARAFAWELGPADVGQLNAGHEVVREDTLDTGRGRYVGGVVYTIIDAPPELVAVVLEDVRAYRQILPCTQAARWIGLSRTGDMLVELEQGNAVARGRYTLRIRSEGRGTDFPILRFSLDRRFGHAIADASGFFRLERAEGGRTLLTYMVLVDLGPGLLQRLFETRIRRLLLSVPRLVRDYAEARARPH